MLEIVDIIMLASSMVTVGAMIFAYLRFFKSDFKTLVLVATLAYFFSAINQMFRVINRYLDNVVLLVLDRVFLFIAMLLVFVTALVIYNFSKKYGFAGG